MKIQRILEKEVKKALIPGRAVIIMGARRVGKTTLLKNILEQVSLENKKVSFLNCDDLEIRTKFSDISLSALKNLFSDTDLIIFDEAQRIKNIGITLKMIVDEMPDKRLIATGSSSLELANEVSESLTGRKKTFYLFPISFLELKSHQDENYFASSENLDQALRFGSYPEIFKMSTQQEKEEYLLELTTDYLYKDALEYQDIRNPEQLRKLLTALALQISQEVSLPELANTVGIDQKTVMRYLDLLEKSFVIFRLPALSRNIRKEISKSRKIYFYDLGIRNALIKNFNTYDLRQDRGHVWENFLVSERKKRDIYLKESKNYYFWRTYDQKEIDLVEEQSGKMTGFEFKWSKEEFKKPLEFLHAYPNSEVSLVNKNQFLDFVS
ncbi:ATP-binding protein [Patescibacteria group bacterium]|nr:ATP-binding protein [Patescibacteria group bacterium]